MIVGKGRNDDDGEKEKMEKGRITKVD